MADVSVDADQFANALDDILTTLAGTVRKGAAGAVKAGLKKGTRAWKDNATIVLSDEYFKTGHWYKTGDYAKSIGSRMTNKGDKPTGEIGSKKLPGLPHLLEKGHARVGGGFVPGRPHIAPAAEEAFEETIDAMDRAVTEALRG